MAVFATTLIVVIVGVASFAYFGTFDVNLINNVAVNINSSSPGNATFISNATQLNLQVPAANMSFTAADNTVAAKEDTAYLDVTLTGSANLLTTCTYDIVYEYDAGSNIYGQGTTTKTSGAIESSNKTVVQLRLKQAGMRWSVEGANYIISLRCMVESNNWSKVEKIVVDYFKNMS